MNRLLQKCIFIFFICNFYFVDVTGQLPSHTNFWPFAGHNLINFKHEPPVIDTVDMVDIGGASAISDKKGRLEFYTNGLSLWDASHKIIKNGKDIIQDTLYSNDSMGGGPKVLILPKNSNSYYVFYGIRHLLGKDHPKKTVYIVCW